MSTQTFHWLAGFRMKDREGLITEMRLRSDMQAFYQQAREQFLQGDPDFIERKFEFFLAEPGRGRFGSVESFFEDATMRSHCKPEEILWKRYYPEP